MIFIVLLIRGRRELVVNARFFACVEARTAKRTSEVVSNDVLNTVSFTSAIWPAHAFTSDLRT